MTLIELMIALVLGILVIAGATSVFMSNKQSYRTNEAIAHLQEGTRTGFDMVARDARNAALTGCGNSGYVANVLKNKGTDWWANWGNAVAGFGGTNADSNPALTTGTSASQHIAGTDSIILIGASDIGYSISNNADGTSTSSPKGFQIGETSPDLLAGDVIVACDPEHATIAQITSIDGSSYITETGTTTPGNCSHDLNFPTLCTSTASYVFLRNSQLAKLNAVSWYLGQNPQGGTSLYRMVVQTATVGGAATPTPTTEEIARNVTAFQLNYHVRGDATFKTAQNVGAAGAANWAAVDAIRISMTIQSTDPSAGVNAQPVSRQMTATIALRNRVN